MVGESAKWRGDAVSAAKRAARAAEAAAGRAAAAAGQIPSRSASREFVSGWMAGSGERPYGPADLDFVALERLGLAVEEIE